MALALPVKEARETLDLLVNTLGISGDVPARLDLLPMTDSRGPLSSSDEGSDALWRLFKAARSSPLDAASVEAAFDSCLDAELNASDLTVALHWSSPLRFLPICKDVGRLISEEKLVVPNPVRGRSYVGFCDFALAQLKESGFEDFPTAVSVSMAASKGRNDRGRNGPLQPMAASCPSYGEEDFESETGILAGRLGSMLSALTSRGCIVLRGPAAVGKSFTARRLAYCAIGARDDRRVFCLQAHPSVTYEDAIVGVLPDDDGNMAVTEGSLMAACDDAEENPETAFAFIVEDIDRADIEAVLGEAMSALDPSRRGQPVPVRYGQELVVPRNIAFIFTMGLSCGSTLEPWSITRMPVFDLEVDFEAAMGPSNSRLADEMTSLNGEIESEMGPAYTLGHGIFLAGMPPADVVETVVLPYIRGLWAEDPDRARAWGSRLRSSLGRHRERSC